MEKLHLPEWLQSHLPAQHRVTWLVAAGATAGALVLTWRSWRYSKKYNLPPGPPSLPLIGNLSKYMGEDFHLNVDRLKKQYGDVFTLWAGSSPVIFINSVGLAREALLQKGNVFAGRLNMWSMDYLFHGGQDIIMGQFTQTWQAQRKVAHSAIRKFATGEQFEELLHSVFEEVADIIQKKEGPINVMSMMLLYIYNVFGRMTIGKSLPLDDPFLQYVQAALDEFAEVTKDGVWADVLPILQYLNTKDVRFIKSFTHTFVGYLEKAFDEHLAKFDPENVQDFTDELINQWKKAQTEEGHSALGNLNKIHLIMTLFDLFFAGTDTTKVTLTFLIGYMCAYPEIQKKMQQEIDDVLGRDGRVTLAARKELPYTDAVLHEVMRCAPAGPFALPHTTACDTTLGSYSLPKGTGVIINIYGFHKDEANFKNADVFDPERWLNEEGKLISQPFSFLPFSMGRRVCVGESLARVELLVVTAMLFQRFTFRAAEGQTVPPRERVAIFAFEPEPLFVHADTRG